MKPAVVVENLLVRLVTYTPRPDRNSLEDFCTETLAWCLRNSALFRAALLRKIGVLLPDEVSPEADIATQVRFKALTLDDADDLAGEDLQTGGRFDLVMISTGARPGFGVVIEAKTRGRIRESQSTLYRKEMLRTPLFSGVRDRGRLVLVGLSARRPEVGDVDRHLRWGDVARLCSESAEQEQNEVVFVLRQFADFLFQKALCMKLDPISSDAIKSWASVTRLRDQLEVILHALHQEFPSSSSRRWQPREDTASGQGGISWLGTYVRSGVMFYVGFALKPRPRPEIFLCAEAQVEGDHPRLADRLPPSLVQAYKDSELVDEGLWRANGKTGIPFVAAMADTAKGGPESVVEWFRNIICDFNRHWKVQSDGKRGPSKD